jgi:hypothetical protein
MGINTVAIATSFDAGIVLRAGRRTREMASSSIDCEATAGGS